MTLIDRAAHFFAATCEGVYAVLPHQLLRAAVDRDVAVARNALDDPDDGGEALEPQQLTWVTIAATLELHAFERRWANSIGLEPHCRCGKSWPERINPRSAWNCHVAQAIVEELAKVIP